MKYFSGFLLLIFFILFSCSEKKIDRKNPIFDSKISIQKRISLVVEQDFLQELDFPDQIKDSIYAFYMQNHFKPVWVNDSMVTEKGAKWKNFLRFPTALGLPDNRLFQLQVDSLKHLPLIQEFYLTGLLFQVNHDLQVGFLDSAQMKYRPILPTTIQNLSASIDEMDTVTKWGSWFANKGFNRPEYRSLAKALFYFAYGKNLSTIHFEIPTIEEDSLGCINLIRESLVAKFYLNKDSVENESYFKTALIAFQKDNGINPNGKINEHTIKALSESEYYKCQRTVLSLERWRWRSQFPERYIWVNIPEYKLRIFYNDTLFSTHSVVVGKPENKTPQLTSRLRAIITLPYWTQPQSIAEKEFLPAMKSNPHYAIKNEYKVFRGKTEVDPLTINWKRYKEKNFPFRVRQEPGEKNALGLVKFEFNNKYGVYLHDTPSKGFFKKDIRAYSHGCVRCEMPDSLARFILTRDEKQKMTRDSLDTLIAHKTNFTIVLRKPIDIQLDYITVTTNEKGKLVFYPDIYERDKTYLDALNIKQE